VLVVAKDRASDKNIFNHRPKNIIVLTDLYPPPGNSCEREGKRKKGESGKEGQRTWLGLMGGATIEPAMHCG
jgi:hypothetical protein